MSGFSWTKEQLAAIESEGTDILVSAAAGSGKTAVLTQRIIRKLTDTNNPVDVTDFLIVTFTVSATTELREKLSNAIRKTYNENRSLKRLKKQILNLPSAKILTIDSFCKFIVSECAKQLDIPADFLTGEESELKRLTDDTVAETLDSFFEGYSCKPLFDTSYLPSDVRRGFLSVVECFSTQKTFDTLNETIIDLYNKLIKYPEPFKRAKGYLNEYDTILREHYINKSKTSFFDTKLGKIITAEIKEAVSTASKYFAEAKELIAQYEEMSAKYSPAVEEDFLSSEHIIASDGAELIKSLSLYVPQRLSSYRPKNDFEKDIQEKFKELRDAGKELISDLKNKYPITDEEKLYLQIANTFSIANELFAVVEEFSRRLWLSKLEMKIFSFDDIAQLAYKALIKEGTYDKETRTFEKTDYAGELSEKFHEILIDEYQDVNELQDTIFKSVSNSHNRFMVGDLKQSIYKFRGATPEIFFEYRNTFKPITSTDGSPRLISLQNNFRSDKSVIDYVNSLFEVVMNYQSEDVYRKDDFLTFSKNEDLNIPTEISIFDQDIEYEYIADKIIEITTKDPRFSFNDICILSRKHDSLQKAQKVLNERGIPSDYTPNENFFKSYEIQTIHSLLKAIDNPTDDVALLSVLTCPFFAFTPAELLKIRETAPRGEIYFALRSYSGDTILEKKSKYAVHVLKKWKNKSRAVGSDTFIWWLYSETHLLSAVKKLNNSKERTNNLITFYNLAIKYEEREFKGITKFLNYLESFISSKNRLGKKNNSENSVHLMTIHDSKGLEFPICFYASSGSLISRADERKKIIMSEIFGPAFSVPVGSLGGKINTYAEKAAIAETRAAVMDEELRLLYVALTRAKNSLIITGHTDISAYIKRLRLDNMCRTSFSYALKNATTILKVIGMGMCSEKLFDNALKSFDNENLTASENLLTINLFASYESQRLTNSPTADNCEVNTVTLNKGDIEKALLPTGCSVLTDTPFKLSVSSIREGLLDEGAVSSISTIKKYPSFMSLDSDNISSFTGTAMHVFMQFCDFDNCIKNGTVNEAERLVKYGFITEMQKQVLNHLTLTAFFSSNCYKNICKAVRVEREKRYTLLLPSSFFFTDEAKKQQLDALNQKTLIQGVIDCYYVNQDNTITLIDFKTDNVSPKDGENILKERHKHQMMLYKEAIEEIEGIKVAKAAVYSFCLSKEIEI